MHCLVTWYSVMVDDMRLHYPCKDFYSHGKLLPVITKTLRASRLIIVGRSLLLLFEMKRIIDFCEC